MSHGRGKRGARPGAPARASLPASRGTGVRLALSAGVIAGLLAGELGPSNWIWGMNILRYYPAAFRVLWSLVAIALIWLLPPIAEPRSGSGDRRLPGGPIVLAFGAATVAAVLFNLFRTESFLLGDGMEIIRRLHQGNVPAPRSPLYNTIEPVFFRTFSGGDARAEGTAAGILSVLSGVVAIGVSTFFLARTARRNPAGALAAGALLLFTGALQLFFGYVEVYPLLTAATIVFYAAAFDRLTGGDVTGAWIATAALLVAVASHPFGFTMFPGWVYLVAMKRDGEGLHLNRRLLLMGLGAGATVIVLFAVVFTVKPELRHVGGAFRYFSPQEVVTGFIKAVAGVNVPRPWADKYRVFSLVHVADTWNTLWIVGAAGFCLVLGILLQKTGRKALSAPPVILALLSLAVIFGARLLFRTPLGSMRDWDLFSGLGLGVAGLGAALALTTPARALAGPITAATLFFLIPWIGIQMSVERAAKRHFDGIEAEPRPEPAVAAYFHCVMGDRFASLRRYDMAARAYQRALEVYPRYEFAWRLGTVKVVTKEYPAAIKALDRALEFSPGDVTTLVVLAEALMGSGDLVRARSALDQVLAKDPKQGVAHLRYGQIEIKEGHLDLGNAQLALADEYLGRDQTAARKEMEDIRRSLGTAN